MGLFQYDNSTKIISFHIWRPKCKLYVSFCFHYNHLFASYFIVTLFVMIISSLFWRGVHNLSWQDEGVGGSLNIKEVLTEGTGGPSIVKVDRNEWWWVRFMYIIIQFTYSVFQENPDSHNTMRVRVFLKHAVCNSSIKKEGNTSVIRSICVLCKILKKNQLYRG